MQHILTQTTIVDASCEEVYAYYSTPQAFQRMVPPWEQMKRVDTDDAQIRGTIARLCFGRSDWIIQMTESRKPYGFTRLLLKGPAAPTIYEHHFKKIAEFKTEVTDHVTYTLRYGFLGTLFLKRQLKKRVKKMLEYRHKILKEDIRRIHQDRMNKPLKILLSGSTGLIGHHLLHLLPLFHHDVYTLVRKPPRHSKEIYWNPSVPQIDQKQLEGFDTVIHLSGEPVGRLRWTEHTKKQIYESRVEGTKFLAETLNALCRPPKMFLCASAVGFYGDCNKRIVDENAPQGEGFLAEVCGAWEQSARMFTQGTVISMRLGIVLAAHQGFLSKWVTPFKTGLAYAIGKGDENWSWISLEDAGYQILHLLRQKEMSGSVNITTPDPVTSSEFSRGLARVLHRRLWFKISRAWAHLLFGEMGDEMLLKSIAAKPRKLQVSGAVFAYPKLSDALKFYLGRVVNSMID
jgi:uncharacterized protein